jgi:hypothetical protein
MQQSSCRSYISRLAVRVAIAIELAIVAIGAEAGSAVAIGLYNPQPRVLAGSPSGIPPDSPTNRIDPNTTSSPFAGVGSIAVRNDAMNPSLITSICTGSPLSATQILTAAHCVAGLNPNNITFNLNYGSDLSSTIGVASLNVNPNFMGFNNPNLANDLAILTLAQVIPNGVPIYSLYGNPLVAGDTLNIVGYGDTGDGVTGYIGSSASLNAKRFGQNNADDFDLGGEIYIFDFDGSDASTNFIGGTTLGNTLETTLGAGDSGSPSFIFSGGGYRLAGVNTFVGTFGGGAPGISLFGSGGGGVDTYYQTTWINDAIGVPFEFSPGLGLLLLGAWGGLTRLKDKLKRH